MGVERDHKSVFDKPESATLWLRSASPDGDGSAAGVYCVGRE